MCVERSIDSLNSAIHNDYHILLRPSSLWEPRHPSLIVNKALDKSCIIPPQVVCLARRARECSSPLLAVTDEIR